MFVDASVPHDVDGAPQHPVYHIAATDQDRAYPTTVSIGTAARMIWGGLWVAPVTIRREEAAVHIVVIHRDATSKFAKKVDVTTRPNEAAGESDIDEYRSTRYWHVAWVCIECIGDHWRL